MDRRSYMRILTEQIRWKKAVPMVTRELEIHIEEQKEDFMADGMTDYEAETAAIKEMGDPVEVGVDMDRLHRPRMNWMAIAAIGFLSILGIAIRCFLESRFAGTEPESHFIIAVPNTVLYMMLGLLAMMLVCYVDYTRIAYRARELMVGYFVILMVGAVVFSWPVNGSRAFIHLFITINLRMAVLLFIPLYCAVLYHYRGEGYRGFLKGVLWSSPMIIVTLCFVSSTITVLVPTIIVILSAAVYKRYFKVNVKKTLIGIWSVAAMLPLAAAMMVFKIGAEYQKARLHLILHAGEYTENYQFNVVRELIRGSKLIGKGADFSEASGAVPDSMSFVLAYIAAYFGVLATVLVIGAIVLLFFRLASHAWKQSNQLGMLMGIGCSTVLLVQIGWYILCNLGFIVVGAVYCPFITSGSSGAIVTYILLGILLSIYRYQSGAPEVKIRKKDRMFQKRKCHEW